MATTAESTQAKGGSPLETLTYDEAMRRYEGEWLILEEVADVSTHGQPLLVRVVARGVTQEATCKAFLSYLDEGGNRHAKHHFVEAAQYIRTGQEMKKALEELAEKGLPEEAEREGPGVGRWL